MANRKIKTLIVGVDFSKYSKVVVQQAKMLSEKLKIPIVYVNIFEQPYVSEWILKTALAELERHFEKEIRKTYKLNKKDKVIVRCGQAFQHILDIAKKFTNPLIVVGHRGKSGVFARFFIGSTAERLALKSPFPVWIHRGKRPIFPKHVLVPCDLTKRGRHALDSVKAMGFGSNLQVELYHVIQPPFPVLDYAAWSNTYERIKEKNISMIRMFKKKNPGLKVVEIEGDINEEIEQQSRKFDLVAITPREHKGSFASFGSVTSKVVRQGDTSVLVVP